MANRPFGGRNQDRQQPYPPQTSEPAVPAAVPLPVQAAPLVQFATAEAAHTVTSPIRERYEHAVAYANTEWDHARGCQTDIDKAAQEIRDAEKAIKERKQLIEQLTLKKQQHMVHGQQGCDVANPAAELLGLAGVHVQKIYAPIIESAVLDFGSDDVKVHPLDTSKPLDSVQGGFPETEPDGYCTQCGEVAWRRPVSETAPKGATHSFGPTCRPEDPDSPVADLGEIQAEAVAS